MKQRRLGANGPLVGEVGLGCMSFAGFYGATAKPESHATLARALELGVTHLDTAIIYGDGLSESVIGEFIRDHPGRFTIASKCGIALQPKRHFNNKPDYIRKALEGSLKRLGVDHIDLYYLHRRDQDVPIEDAMETMAALVREGKIGGIGLSEIAPTTLERASAIHPVMAVQNEYSLWTRLPELGVIQACQRLGTSFVPFSPLGRGVFADTVPNPEAFGDTDFRKANPRFAKDNYARSNVRVQKFRDYARDHGWNTSALALAWTLAQGDHIVPIPGTRSADHLAQLATASDIILTEHHLEEIEEILPAGFAHGPRYSDAQMVGPENYC